MKQKSTLRFWHYCLLVVFGLLGNNTYAQDLVNVQVRVVEVAHNHQCCDDAAGCCGSFFCGFQNDSPEPRYRVRARTNHQGTFGTYSTVQVINLGTSNCGSYTQNITLVNATAICADEIQVDVDMWEDDGCGSNTTFNTCTFNSDENRTQASPTSLLSSYTQGVANTFDVTGTGGYRVTFEVIWSEVSAPTLDPSSVTSNCAGGTVNLNVNNSLSIPGGDFYWYTSAASTSPVFVGNPYMPTVAGNTSYFVAYGDGSCETSRLQVNVTEVILATPTAMGVSACPGTTPTLTATGGGVGVVGYNWYDDAVKTTLLGSGANFVTPPVSGTINYYVAADYGSGCESAAIPVTVTELPSPPTPSAGNQQYCANQNVILTATGTGGTLNWYTAPIGGTSVGSGSPFNVGQLTAGNYTYYVAEFDGTCEGGRAAVIVDVDAIPNPPLAPGQMVCLGAPAALSASEPTAVNFNWYTSFPLTTPVSTGSVYNTPAITAPTTFYVTAINADGCESDTTEVVVDVNTVIAPIATGMAICPGDTAVLTAMAPGSIEIRWYQNSDRTGYLASGSNYTTGILSVNTTYYVTALYPNGCESLVTPVTVTVNTAPTIPAVSNLIVCDVDSVIFTGFGSGGTISWYDAAAGGTLLGTGATYNAGVLSAGTLVVYAAEGNGNCSSARVAAVATIHATPAAPTVTPDTICDGEMALLTVGTATGVYNWYSDAALTALVFVGNTFSTPALTANTTYYVTARSNNNCESAATQVDVVVNLRPTTPMATPDTICDGETATLTTTNAGGTTNWYSNATGTNLVATGTSFTTAALNQNMTYYVSETSAAGCQSTLVPVTVVVNNLPNRPAVNTVIVCAGDDVILSATGSGVGDLVFYDNTNTEIGRTTMTLANPTATLNLGALAVGTYTYIAREENNGCESAQAFINVTVNTLPVAPTAINDGPACEGDVLVLQATPAVTGGIFSWTGPNGFVSNSQTVVLSNVTAAQAGQYSVNVTIGSCTSTDGSTTVTINPKPVLGAAITNNGPLCEGDNLVMTAPTVANVTYNWDGPNGFTATGNPATINNVTALTNQGAYSVSITDNATNCTSDKEFTLVQINELPATNTILTNSPVCEGQDLALSVPQVFGATYAWTGPNGFTATSNSDTITGATTLASGIYSVTITKGTCTVNLSATVAVSALPSITMIGDTTIKEGDNIVLHATGGVTYQWAPSTYLSNANLPTPILSGAPIGTYTYTVNVTNAQGCTAADSVTITVEPQTILKVVDLFTPNGDGVNDTWEVNFLQNVGAYTIQVFSRGGIEVMHTENYANDWGGTHNGKALPEGTYWYIIRTDLKEYKGPVTIKR